MAHWHALPPAPQPVGRGLHLPPPPDLPAIGDVPGPRLVQDGNNQYLSIQPWHQSRMEAQFSQQTPTNLENSAYGPIDRLLNAQFISDWGFMVKPQGVLRRKLMDERVAQLHNQTSNGGIGGPPELTPDFIVVKGGPSLFQDVILAIIEIKRPIGDTDSVHIRRVDERAEAQISNYLTKAAWEETVVKHLYGFLIVGKKTTTYWLNTQEHRNSGIEPTIVVDNLSTHGPEFKDQLFAMAWSYRGGVHPNWYTIGPGNNA